MFKKKPRQAVESHVTLVMTNDLNVDAINRYLEKGPTFNGVDVTPEELVKVLGNCAARRSAPSLPLGPGVNSVDL